MAIGKTVSRAFALSGFLLLTACGQTVPDFNKGATTVLTSSCMSQALLGLKAHIFADWTSAEIDRNANDANVAALTAFDTLGWELGVSKTEMSSMMSDARSHGQVLWPQVAITPYKDKADAVNSINGLCKGYATGVVKGFQPRLKK